jgi:hypothetical protein
MISFDLFFTGFLEANGNLAICLLKNKLESGFRWQESWKMALDWGNSLIKLFVQFR